MMVEGNAAGLSILGQEVEKVLVEEEVEVMEVMEGEGKVAPEGMAMVEVVGAGLEGAGWGMVMEGVEGEEAVGCVGVRVEDYEEEEVVICVPVVEVMGREVCLV